MIKRQYICVEVQNRVVAHCRDTHVIPRVPYKSWMFIRDRLNVWVVEGIKMAVSLPLTVPKVLP